MVFLLYNLHSLVAKKQIAWVVYMVDRSVKVEHLLAHSIQELGLSHRAFCLLKRSRIETVGQVVNLDDEALKNIRSMGKKTIMEIRERVTDYLASGKADLIIENDAQVKVDDLVSFLNGESLSWWVSHWFANLTDQEKNVLYGRYGLDGSKPLTLEEVAANCFVTRERIRQIQEKALHQLSLSAYWVKFCLLFIDYVVVLIIEKGGLIGKNELLTCIEERNDFDCGDVSLWHLVQLVGDIDKYKNWFYMRNIDALAKDKNSAKQITSISNSLKAYIEKKCSSVELATLYKICELSAPIDFVARCVALLDKLTIDERKMVGLSSEHWRRKATIYDILRVHGRPMHFEKLAYAINKRVAMDQQFTPHNLNAYLVRYSEVFVRVGKGLFGLAEWGLGNDGNLANAAYRVILEAECPLHITTITQQVLETWEVNRESIYAAMQNDNRFIGLGNGVYTVEGIDVVTVATLSEHTQIPLPIIQLEAYGKEIADWEKRFWVWLEKEELIGELPISREQFEEICGYVRKEAIIDGKIKLNNVPPATFMATMVFAARYSENEASNFWDPYAHLVWGLDEASMNFQTKCRYHFNQSAEFLREKFNLDFSVTQAGYRTVSPIYRHAIIPAYLQDDFAKWIVQHSQTILEDGDYRLKLNDEIKAQKAPLRNFLNDEDTRISANKLVQNMATILQLYHEGAIANDIAQLLENSPIEREIWQELLALLAGNVEARNVKDKKQTGRIDWIWCLDSDEMRLRLSKFVMKSEPERVVWADADRELFIDPWTTSEGNWLIDEVELDGTTQGETIRIVDEDDTVLEERNVPTLSSDSALFFRPYPAQDNQDRALFVERERIQDGEWWICVKEGFSLYDANKKLIEAKKDLSVPDGLVGMAKAGIYDISLPIEIGDGNNIVVIEAKEKSDIRPKLFAPLPFRILNLSTKTPPVFTTSNVTLRVQGADEKLIHRTWLRLVCGQQVAQYPVSDLNIKWEADGTVSIPLEALLKPTAAMYSVQLHQKGRGLFPEVLEFGILPNVQVSPPDTYDKVYTTHDLPSCVVRGISAENIIPNPDRFSFEQTPNGEIRIQWHDLRDGCRLPLKVEAHHFTLAWDIQSYFAWLTPPNNKSYLTPERFNQSTLSVIAPTKREKTPHYIEWFHLHVNGESRRYEMPRKGRVHIPLRNDPLRDILEQAEQPSNIITIQMREVRWPIVEVRRFPDIKQVQVDYDVMGDDCNVIFSCQLDAVWEGPFEFFLQALHRPFDSPIKLLETNYLKELIIFPIRLTDGHYFLDICYDGESLPLPNQTSSIIVGDGQNKLQSPNYRKLLNYLRGKEKGMVESSYAADFVRILADHADTIQLTPQYLYQLATLSVSSYQNLPVEKLEALWRPLAQLATLQDVKQWHNRYGMLPAWIVTNNGLYMSTIESGRRIQITPLGLLLKGKWGVGEIFLKSSDNNRKRVYARWEPAQNNDEIRLTMFWFQDTQIEQDDYSALTQEFVEGDGSSVYLCKSEDCLRCFILHPKYVSSFDDPLVKQHLHNRRQSVSYAHELFYDMSSEGIPITVRPTEHAKSTLTDESVKPTQVKLYLQDVMALPPVIGESHSPISHDVHEQATWQWVKRYRDDPVAKKELDRLAYTYRWQDSLKQLQGLLLKHDVPRTVYLLETLWQDEPLENLDCDIVLLAFLLRYTSYKPDEMRDLCQQIGLVINDLVEMLEIANHYCPELLLWAMNWIELFHLHGI